MNVTMSCISLPYNTCRNQSEVGRVPKGANTSLASNDEGMGNIPWQTRHSTH